MRRVAAEHDESAMREIDDVEHAPDQRHAERHEAVETAEQDAVEKDLREEHGSDCRPLRALGYLLRLVQADTG